MRIESLIYLGLSGQDFGPCYTDDFTHAQFAAKWRGTGACPSEAEIEAAYAPGQIAAANMAIQSQIDAIERATLTNRGAREGWITIIRKEAAAQGVTDDSVIASINPFFSKLMEIDAQVKALRDQLNA
jgi:hypothetical protein